MMKTLSPKARFYWGFIVTILGAIVILLSAVANGPDYDLRFTREIESDLSVPQIEKAITFVGNWPDWFFSLKDAKVLDYHGVPLSLRDQILATGEDIRLWMDPKKGKRREFQLLLRVLRYVPGKVATFRIQTDSSGRLTRMFSEINWEIELIPSGQKTLIRGTALAHTCHWRSRLMGRLAERIVMNQVFYPDLASLSKITLPRDQAPFSVAPQ